MYWSNGQIDLTTTDPLMGSALLIGSCSPGFLVAHQELMMAGQVYMRLRSQTKIWHGIIKYSYLENFKNHETTSLIIWLTSQQSYFRTPKKRYTFLKRKTLIDLLFRFCSSIWTLNSINCAGRFERDNLKLISFTSEPHNGHKAFSLIWRKYWI